MLFRKFKQYFSWIRQAGTVAFIFSTILVLAAMPWNVLIDRIWQVDLTGVPLGFMTMILFLPIAVLFLLSSFVKIAEDIDRHDPELENE